MERTWSGFHHGAPARKSLAAACGRRRRLSDHVRRRPNGSRRASARARRRRPVAATCRRRGRAARACSSWRQRRNRLPTDEASGARGPRRLRGEARRELGGRQVEGARLPVATLNVGAYMLGDRRRRPTSSGAAAPRCTAPASPASTTARSSAACAEIIDRVDQLGLGRSCTSRRRCSSAPPEGTGHLPRFYERAGYRLVACGLRRRRPTTRSSAATLRGRSWARRSTAATAARQRGSAARAAAAPRDRKLGHLGTLTNVHLRRPPPADAVAAEREREQREGADASPPLVSGAAGGGGFNALLHGTNSEKRTSPAPRRTRRRRALAQGLAGRAAGERRSWRLPRRLSLANVVQVQQAVVSARNDNDLFKAHASSGPNSSAPSAQTRRSARQRARRSCAATSARRSTTFSLRR